MPLEPAPLRCSVFIAVSVDGFIARPDGSIDWLEAVNLEGEDYGYSQFASSVDVLVMGRNTYEVALGFDAWPYAGKRVIVLTHRPTSPRHGEETFDGHPADLVERLRRDGACRAYVDGGNVIQQFLAAGLVDDLTLSVIPVLLGSGIPLFASGGPTQRLTLEESRSFSSGLAQLRYRVG